MRHQQLFHEHQMIAILFAEYSNILLLSVGVSSPIYVCRRPRCWKVEGSNPQVLNDRQGPQVWTKYWPLPFGGCL